MTTQRDDLRGLVDEMRATDKWPTKEQVLAWATDAHTLEARLAAAEGLVERMRDAAALSGAQAQAEQNAYLAGETNAVMRYADELSAILTEADDTIDHGAASQLALDHSCELGPLGTLSDAYRDLSRRLTEALAVPTDNTMGVYGFDQCDYSYVRELIASRAERLGVKP